MFGSGRRSRFPWIEFLNVDIKSIDLDMHGKITAAASYER